MVEHDVGVSDGDCVDFGDYCHRLMLVKVVDDDSHSPYPSNARHTGVVVDDIVLELDEHIRHVAKEHADNVGGSCRERILVQQHGCAHHMVAVVGVCGSH